MLSEEECARLQAMRMLCVRTVRKFRIHHHDVEDIISKALLKVVKHYDPTRGKLESLMLTCCKQVAIDHLRRQKHVEASMDTDILADEIPLKYVNYDSELLRTHMPSLERVGLKKNTRALACYLAYSLAGGSIRVASMLTGSSESTVHAGVTRYKRAVSKLDPPGPEARVRNRRRKGIVSIKKLIEMYAPGSGRHDGY